ncbi:hypothetical protein LUZ60_014913 [Juncus effusus]|nr:hypothetical protein LUZ60_014913 [Juncus effusus]
MGRAPCCEKVGLKKGPWSPEEDGTLVSYIEKHGHGNWRALPKQAGLLRCGKSCRLRWINYLRPDIKRGNFTKEEEDMIIGLHQSLGNRWSAIAAQLPGRTDNEIKNIWHTHLKKKLMPSSPVSKQPRRKNAKPKTETNIISLSPNNSQPEPVSSFSSFSTDQSCSEKEAESFLSVENITEIDESFWTETLSMDTTTDSVSPINQTTENSFGDFSGCMIGDADQYSINDDKEFWLKVFVEAGGNMDLSQV